MSDSVVVLSSGDESEHGQDDVKERLKDNPDDNDNEEHSGGTSKKRKIQPSYLGKPEQQEKKRRESNGSISPTEDHEIAFNEFVEICLKLDDKKSQLEKIIDKKLRKYYMLLVPEYRNSEQFITLLQRKGAEMERSPSQMFVHIKEVVDELYVHRSDKIEKPAVNVSDRTIRKLCKAMELIHRKIKKLEQKEVNWDDDGDSSYIQLQRYRERLLKIDAKLRELEGNTAPGFHKKISFSGTKFPRINRAIEKYVNAKGKFPDYYDIYHLLKMEYEKEKIDISTLKLKCEAKSIFQNIGEQLQNIRKTEIWEAHRSFLSDEVLIDPADNDEELQNVLDENKKKFQASIDEIINVYAEKPTTKSQFESEDSNSSEGKTAIHQKEAKSKEINSANKEEGKEEEKDSSNADKGEVEDEKDDGGGNGDDEEEEEDEDEEEGNGKETVDDILNDIGEEEQEDLVDATECVFLHCGPVSPPVPLEEEEECPEVVCYADSEGDGKEQVKNKEARVADIISVLEKSIELESVPGCSKWDNNDKQSRTNNRENDGKNSHETVRVTPQPQTFLKVKPLTTLQNKESSSLPEEILLD